MNKKAIITILLVLVAMTGLAQSSIPESIVDTYWRNEVTGDWILDSQKVVPSMTAKYGSTAI